MNHRRDLSLLDIYFISGVTTYLTLVHDVEMPINPLSYCSMTLAVLFTATLCSTLLIFSMTFDRFYSIIRPQKAASFNTIKRANITITCIVIFSLIFNIPHWFTTLNIEWFCLPYDNEIIMARSYSQLYYWTSFVLQFVFPFVSLLIMNSFIIHTLKNRTKNLEIDESNNKGQGHSQGQSQGQGTRMKGSEKQVFAILLLVTFGFLILSTPMYLYFTLNLFINFTASPKIFAINHLITNIAQKLHYTNHGINFFFYVISGQKFRTDLIKLFKREGAKSNLTVKSISRDTS